MYRSVPGLQGHLMGEEEEMEQQEKVIFVIEDDAEMVLLLHLMFRQHRIKIINKLTGEESLAAMKTQKPDLVLLDIMMPGLDGWEIYQRMKNSTELREIPIIVVTAKPEWLARRDGQFFDRVVGYVVKPVKPLSLIGLVEHHLTAPPTPVKPTANCPPSA